MVSLWSSLEGSILFWGLILGAYIALATTLHCSDRHPELLPDAIGRLAGLRGLLRFLLAGPAQPFLTMPNPPADGPGPNPLLQNHVLMVIHPPFLYLGLRRDDHPLRPRLRGAARGPPGRRTSSGRCATWLLLPWIFLTCAIVLGGWWAYEVLGWGGYWAWDPVENASLPALAHRHRRAALRDPHRAQGHPEGLDDRR